jgi:hypothetical protein
MGKACMRSTRDTIINSQIKDVAERFAKDPQAFFFYAVALNLGIKESEVAERLQRAVLVTA